MESNFPPFLRRPAQIPRAFSRGCGRGQSYRDRGIYRIGDKSHRVRASCVSTIFFLSGIRWQHGHRHREETLSQPSGGGEVPKDTPGYLVRKERVGGKDINCIVSFPFFRSRRIGLRAAVIGCPHRGECGKGFLRVNTGSACSKYTLPVLMIT